MASDRLIYGGERLKELKVVAIYCSDLKRAVETSQIINQFTNVEIKFRAKLGEIDMGEIFTKGCDAYPACHFA
jgi:broad specificity phosphatase PhoE